MGRFRSITVGFLISAIPFFGAAGAFALGTDCDAKDGGSVCLEWRATELPDLIVRAIRLDRVSDDQVTLDFQVRNSGKAPVTDLFPIAIYVDGRIFKHTYYRQMRQGTTYDKDPTAVIPLMPQRAHRFSVGGFASLMTGKHVIEVVVDRLDKGDPATEKARAIYRNNQITESREDNNAAVRRR